MGKRRIDRPDIHPAPSKGEVERERRAVQAAAQRRESATRHAARDRGAAAVAGQVRSVDITSAVKPGRDPVADLAAVADLTLEQAQAMLQSMSNPPASRPIITAQQGVNSQGNQLSSMDWRSLESRITAAVEREVVHARTKWLTATEVLNADSVYNMARALADQLTDTEPVKGPRDNWRRAGPLMVSIAGPARALVLVNIETARITVVGDLVDLAPDETRWLASRMGDAAGWLAMNGVDYEEPEVPGPF